MDDAFEILGRAQFEFVLPANSYNGMDGRRADNAQMKMWLSAEAVKNSVSMGKNLF